MASILYDTSITSNAWLSGCTIKKVDSLEIIMPVDRISMIYYEHCQDNTIKPTYASD